MDSDGLAGSFIILALVLIKGFFTVCETALAEIGDSKVKSFENGTGAERRLFKLLESPSRLMTVFAVNRITSAMLLMYAALFSYAKPVAEWLLSLFIKDGNGAEAWRTLGFIASAFIIMLIAVFVLTVLCEGVPKHIALNSDAEKLAVMAAFPVSILVVLLKPFTFISDHAIRLIVSLAGYKGDFKGDAVTEEEILMMVDAGNETGVIEETQREMINNVFEFNDLTASDVMTHRTDIVGVDTKASISEVVNAAISSGFSRIPVYKGSMDHITGMICVKDLLCMVGSEAASTASAKDFVREIIYVPETIPCGELFKQLSEKKMQMAVVADEYGGTAGIVTMEDVVESIVGNIQDEYDDEAEEIVRISDDTFTIDGTAAPDHILEQLGITLPADNDFDTMSGFIVSLLGRIPEENENPVVKYGNVVFTVLITEDMCITKLKATICTDDENNNEINEKESSEENEH
ncbi:MAG: HlyC/CorC family transporter [Oscillospiraceae bacterium]|nr:HlyC/CorC family transporter [Oscillospiraceae bacterium]